MVAKGNLYMTFFHTPSHCTTVVLMGSVRSGTYKIRAQKNLCVGSIENGSTKGKTLKMLILAVFFFNTGQLFFNTTVDITEF